VAQCYARARSTPTSKNKKLTYNYTYKKKAVTHKSDVAVFFYRTKWGAPPPNPPEGGEMKGGNNYPRRLVGLIKGCTSCRASPQAP